MMQNPIRYLLSRLRGEPRERRRAPRYDARLSFSVWMLEEGGGLEGAQPLVGRTRNISETGFALIVPSLYFGTRKLDDKNATLRIMLDLPDETVEIYVVPLRSHQLPKDDPERGYFIGAQITQLSDHARARLTKFLRSLRPPH